MELLSKEREKITEWAWKNILRSTEPPITPKKEKKIKQILNKLLERNRGVRSEASIKES